MTDLEEAQRRIIAACDALGSETVALEAALGRVLGEDLRAPADIVPFARSAMDGFAVRAADTLGAPLDLPVRAVVYAEAGVARHAAGGSATAIATGAPLPLGADAVIPLEDTEPGGARVRILEAVITGQHVFPPGDDARGGDLLAAAGTMLAPGSLALAAAAGHARIRVVRRPRVAIVCSGAELVDVDRVPGFGEIRNSNGTLVAAIVTSYGADVVRNVRVTDDSAALRAEFARCLADADLLVTTGGASVGERDLVKAVLGELGVTFEFDSVALRPARPTAFGRHGDARVAVLAGNPAAAFVALHELVRPGLLGLAGRGAADLRLPRVTARLNGSLHAKARRTYLPFVRLRIDRGGLVALPLDNQCSALTRTASDANGLAVVEGDAGDLHTGAIVPVDVYDWARVRSVVDTEDRFRPGDERTTAGSDLAAPRRN